MLSSDVVQTYCYERYCRVSTDIRHIVVLDGEQIMIVLVKHSVNFKT